MTQAPAALRCLRAMFRPLPLLLALGACGTNTPVAPVSPTEPIPPAPVAPSYEVHEWGLVRRAFPDRVLLSGPPGSMRPMPIAKPVLYFHRDGEGPLTIDVEVSMPSGHVVEHWPLTTTTPSPTTIRWEDVAIVEGNCPGARYPSETEAPCNFVTDFCEAAELALVESDDGACVRVGGAPFDHLFYRGEVTSPPTFPLELALEGDTLRVTHRGRAPIPGQLVRVRRGGAVVSVVDPPRPGDSVILPAPSTPNGQGARALEASLQAAGLTEAEARAFARAWDSELFGVITASTEPSVTTIPPVTAAMPMPPSDDALLYVLPIEDADPLATLRFDPPPRVVRRAIVAWIDVALGQPVRR